MCRFVINVKEETMSTDVGYIKLFRSTRNHWIWNNPYHFKWWLDILMTANDEDEKVSIGMQVIECKRGQAIISLSNWARRWGVSKSKVQRFLKMLENDGMICLENVTKTTRITVCNYDNY